MRRAATEADAEEITSDVSYGLALSEEVTAAFVNPELPIANYNEITGLHNSNGGGSNWTSHSLELGEYDDEFPILTGNDFYRCLGIADCGICVSSPHCQWCTIKETGEGFCTELNKCPRKADSVSRTGCSGTGISCERCAEITDYLLQVSASAQVQQGYLGDVPANELSGWRSSCVPAPQCRLREMNRTGPVTKCFGKNECKNIVSFVYLKAFGSDDSNTTALIVAFFLTITIMAAFA